MCRGVGAQWELRRALARADQSLGHYDASVRAHVDRRFPRVGVSVESAEYTWRIAHLAKVPAAVRFLSVEPLLGPIPRLPLRGIDWVILGGESGPSARPMAAAWAEQIRDRCVEVKVPFFFKQWGGVWKKRTGRVLDGRAWDEMPTGSDRHAAVSAK
jgi:protein gp37